MGDWQLAVHMMLWLHHKVTEQSPFPAVQAVLFEGCMVATITKVFIILYCCASMAA